MCFSASASFSAGIVLVVIGTVTLRKVRHPSQILFASIPLIFGIQQIAEGALWLTLPKPEYLTIQKLATYIFLFFAQVVWPIWVPIAILKLENSESKRRIQSVLVGAGLIVGIYLGACLFNYDVQAKVIGHHISYVQDYPHLLRYYGIILYAMATIIPTFFSSIKSMWMLGVSVLISYIVTAVFYEHYVLSVWCFFASIISLSIYAITVEVSKPQQRNI